MNLDDIVEATRGGQGVANLAGMFQAGVQVRQAHQHGLNDILQSPTNAARR